MSLFVLRHVEDACEHCSGEGKYSDDWENPPVKHVCQDCRGTGIALTEVGRELVDLLRKLNLGLASVAELRVR